VARHDVYAFVFDKHNIAEMARHGVSQPEAEQLIWNRNVIAANPRGRPGSVMLIGETDGGRLLTVPLAPTSDPSAWRPATAFDASRHQRSIFDRRYR
jgi:uncharacterized DUF497 family protein